MLTFILLKLNLFFPLKKKMMIVVLKNSMTWGGKSYCTLTATFAAKVLPGGKY